VLIEHQTGIQHLVGRTGDQRDGTPTSQILCLRAVSLRKVWIAAAARLLAHRTLSVSLKPMMGKYSQHHQTRALVCGLFDQAARLASGCPRHSGLRHSARQRP